MNILRRMLDWRLVIIGINLFFIIMTGIFPYIRNDFLKWNVVNHFNLMGEMTLAAWWSGSLMLICAVLAYQISSRDNESRYAWIIIALVFSILSFDEIASIHERARNFTEGSVALLIAALIGGFGYIYACWILWRDKFNKRGAILLLLGMAVLGLAVPNEYFEHRINWPYYLIGPRAAFEEGLEVSGVLICLMGITRYQPITRVKGSLFELTLNPDRLSRWITIVTFGFMIHVIISWIVVGYITIDFRGNPAAWYFMVLFFVLAFIYGGKIIDERPFLRYQYTFLAIYFMALSVGSMYFILPRFNSKLHDLWLMANSNVFLGIQLLFMVFIFVFLERRLAYTVTIKFFIIALALVLGWYMENQFVSYVVSGFFALMATSLFIPRKDVVISNEQVAVSY
jgi:hypothetical protein